MPVKSLVNNPEWNNLDPVELQEVSNGPRPFKISEKVYVCEVKTSSAEEMYHETFESGVYSFVTVDEHENMTLQDIFVVYQYTLRRKAHRLSTVTFHGKKHIVTRRTVNCSGIQICETMTAGKVGSSTKVSSSVPNWA